ncbi:hypothetical protein C8Q80DRAFT_313145 [Daedaleopsis nitida]|nr:hypothetical protein C8Q80DRAFT_313145 [Daedaleopsis nitida]
MEAEAVLYRHVIVGAHFEKFSGFLASLAKNPRRGRAVRTLCILAPRERWVRQVRPPSATQKIRSLVARNRSPVHIDMARLCANMTSAFATLVNLVDVDFYPSLLDFVPSADGHTSYNRSIHLTVDAGRRPRSGPFACSLKPRLSLTFRGNWHRCLVLAHPTDAARNLQTNPRDELRRNLLFGEYTTHHYLASLADRLVSITLVVDGSHRVLFDGARHLWPTQLLQSARLPCLERLEVDEVDGRYEMPQGPSKLVIDPLAHLLDALLNCPRLKSLVWRPAPFHLNLVAAHESILAAFVRYPTTLFAAFYLLERVVMPKTVGARSGEYVEIVRGQDGVFTANPLSTGTA